MKKISMAMLFLFLAAFCGCGHSTYTTVEKSDALTWWCQNKYSGVSNTGESPVYSRLMEETGVEAVFIHPPEGEHRERFLSLLDDEKLPDIITHDFVNDYAGGVEKALNDGVIAALNDIIENHCPNLRTYLNENPDIKELISTKDGRIFCFPSIQKDRRIRTYMGPYVRSDYLVSLDLKEPVTVNEWYDVMTAFKQELDITPLTFYGGKIIDTNFLIGAYGISWDFYLEDEEVKFGPMEDGFSDFMYELKRWYDQGLIAKGIFTDAQRTYTAKAKRGNIGIYVDYISSIVNYQNEIKGAKFSPLSYPVEEYGSVAFSGHIAPVFVPYSSCYISRDNKDIVSTAKLLDYAYSDEGSLLFNFGILGESYVMEDGEPKYSEKMYDGNGFYEEVKKYLASGAYIRDERQFEQMLVLESQKEAIDIWAQTEANEHRLEPVVLSAQQAETVSAFNGVYKDILLEWLKDYCLSKSETDVDELREKLCDIGIENVISIYQEVIDERR